MWDVRRPVHSKISTLIQRSQSKEDLDNQVESSGSVCASEGKDIWWLIETSRPITQNCIFAKTTFGVITPQILLRINVRLAVRYRK